MCIITDEISIDKIKKINFRFSSLSTKIPLVNKIFLFFFLFLLLKSEINI